MVAVHSFNFPQALPQKHPHKIKPSSLLFWSQQTVVHWNYFYLSFIEYYHIKSVCVDVSMQLTMTTHSQKIYGEGRHEAQGVEQVEW